MLFINYNSYLEECLLLDVFLGYVIGIVINYLCDKRESVFVLINSFWCGKSKGLRDVLGYVFVIRYIMYYYFFFID